ncbi:MAG TPA: hypothetical protein VN634_08555 [Candidatus Limnocylindrales bacterium]|nr:hypothetical protein [Candidatus Limnocylindrales bacterium]
MREHSPGNVTWVSSDASRPPTPANIELRCAAHNQYQADLDFGRGFMDARRGNPADARTFPGECRGMAAAP